jgi:predicted AAA+ superfamily ATPase
VVVDARVLRGNFCEALVIARLTGLGFEVFGQIGGGSKTDLIAKKNGRLIQIQVKSAMAHNQRKVGVIRIFRPASKQRFKRYYYSQTDVDFFVCVDQEENCFVIPFKESLAIGSPSVGSEGMQRYKNAWHLMEEKKGKWKEAA